MELFERFKKINSWGTYDYDKFTKKEKKKLFSYICSLKRKENNLKDLGENSSYYQLGRYYTLEGNKDLTKKWFTRAASICHRDAMFLLGFLYEVHFLYEFEEPYQAWKNYEYNKDMTEEWYIKAANLGHADAMCRLGIFYENEEDYEKAKEWFLKAENEHGKGEYYLMLLRKKCPDLFKRKLSQIYDSESCCICNEDYLENIKYKITFNCGHTFHYECVKEEKKCPTCEEPVNF